MESLPPAPPGGDRNRADALLTIFWVPFPIIVLMISLRFYIRISIKSVGLDDYLMLITGVGKSYSIKQYPGLTS